MSQPISVMELVKQSTKFVFSNIDVLKDHLKIIFPMALLIQLINSLSIAYGVKWVELVTFIPLMYLYACFALSWHRTSLIGANSIHAINPLEWRSENKGFMLVFAALMILPIVVGAIVGFLGGFVVMASGSEAVIGILILLLIPLSIYLIIQFIRLSFMLPARSLDVKLTMKEARQASRGLVSRILGAGFIVGLGFIGAIMLYALIVGMTVAMMMSGDEPSPLMTGIMTFIFAIPYLALGYMMMAVNITILSKAYQWGMQNNSTV